MLCLQCEAATKATSRTHINSSNHLSDIGTINLKEITKLMFPKLSFAHTTAVAENVQFDLHTQFWLLHRHF